MKLEDIIEEQNKFLILDDKDISELKEQLTFLENESFGKKAFKDYFAFEHQHIKSVLSTIQHAYGDGYKKMISKYLDVPYNKILYLTSTFGNYSIEHSSSYQSEVYELLKKNKNVGFSLGEFTKQLGVKIDSTTLTRLMSKTKDIRQRESKYYYVGD